MIHLSADPSQPLSLIRPSIHSSRVRTPITSEVATVKKYCNDRGHLAAAGNHRKSRNSIDQTFFLTNMSPQVGRGFNRDKWNDVEIHVRRLAKKDRNVYICTGPLYLPQKESDGNFYVRYMQIFHFMIRGKEISIDLKNWFFKFEAESHSQQQLFSATPAWYQEDLQPRAFQSQVRQQPAIQWPGEQERSGHSAKEGRQGVQVTTKIKNSALHPALSTTRVFLDKNDRRTLKSVKKAVKSYKSAHAKHCLRLTSQILRSQKTPTKKHQPKNAILEVGRKNLLNSINRSIVEYF
uniref:Endonuclease n=1 Tax=Ditylenchus dipsaci TaxID=166011 RepID=A0A915EI20_9BILA